MQNCHVGRVCLHVSSFFFLFCLTFLSFQITDIEVWSPWEFRSFGTE